VASSGIYSFSQTRDQILRRALLLIKVIDMSDASVPSAELAFAADSLNLLVKEWMTQDLPLWKKKEATLFTAKDTHSYSLSSSGWNATQSYVSTTITPAEASGQTVISVASSTGMTAGDYVGIELDAGTRQWTTIVSVDSATQITITAALTGAAASGNTVVSYTTKIQRPLRLLAARVMNLVDLVEIPMTEIRHEEYQAQPVKGTDSNPSVFYYDKQLSSGSLKIYPEANTVKTVINFTYHEPIQDFTASTDEADFPVEWLNPLIWGLALDMAPYFSVSADDIALLGQAAIDKINKAKEWNNEEASLIMTPNISYPTRRAM
jgi:hypothetical protein